MAHVSRRTAFGIIFTVLAIVIIVIIGIIGSVATIQTHKVAPHSTPTSSSPSESGQSLYVARLMEDEQSLDRGVLLYSPIGNLNTGAMREFSVIVLDVGRGPQHGQVPEFNGMTVDQQDVPTGGIIGVQIVGCENLTCQSQSYPEQPVLVEGQHAQWYWLITAGTPGPAEITLRVGTYDQGSAQVLAEEIVRINAEVVPTPIYNNQQRHKAIVSTAKSVVGDIVTIGSVATAILAVGGVVGWVVARRRKKGKTNMSEKEQSKQAEVGQE